MICASSAPICGEVNKTFMNTGFIERLDAQCQRKIQSSVRLKHCFLKLAKIPRKFATARIHKCSWIQTVISFRETGVNTRFHVFQLRPLRGVSLMARSRALPEFGYGIAAAMPQNIQLFENFIIPQHQTPAVRRSLRPTHIFPMNLCSAI